MKFFRVSINLREVDSSICWGRFGFKFTCFFFEFLSHRVIQSTIDRDKYAFGLWSDLFFNTVSLYSKYLF